MHNAQCLEKQLCIMLVLAEPSFFTQSPEERDSLFDAVLSKTFGAVWAKLNKLVPFDCDLVAQIAKAKDLRNNLAHNYFWKHAADLLNPKKQELLIEELTEMADLFNDLDNHLTKITDIYSAQLGITEEQIAIELEKLKEQ